MNNSELKYALFKAIDNIDNNELLKDVYALIQEKTGADYWNSLTDEQKQEIDKAIASLDSGKGVPHEVVMAKFKGKYFD